MNIGQNFYNLFMEDLRPIVLFGLAVGAVVFYFRRESSKLVSFILMGIFVVAFVFQTPLVQRVMENIATKILGG